MQRCVCHLPVIQLSGPCVTHLLNCILPQLVSNWNFPKYPKVLSVGTVSHSSRNAGEPPSRPVPALPDVVESHAPQNLKSCAPLDVKSWGRTSSLVRKNRRRALCTGRFDLSNRPLDPSQRIEPDSRAAGKRILLENRGAASRMCARKNSPPERTRHESCFFSPRELSYKS